MIAYYSLGAGLGHISRCFKVLKLLGIQCDVTLLTNSRLQVQPETQRWISMLQAGFAERNAPYRVYIRHVPNERAKHATPQASNRREAEALGIWVIRQLQEIKPDKLYIDAFPAGINGELSMLDSQFPNLSITYVARHLKWQAYQSSILLPIRFDQCYITESLAKQHQAFVESSSDSWEQLDLKGLPLEDSLSDVNRQSLELDVARLGHFQPFCAVLHTGSSEEIETLLEYAYDRLKIEKRRLNVLLFSPDSFNGLERYDGLEQIVAFPAGPFTKQAECIVSAAGFNTIYEHWNHNKKHWVIPFTRKYDDQFGRAALYNEHKRKFVPD